jgi:hypothetical protein
MRSLPSRFQSKQLLSVGLRPILGRLEGAYTHACGFVAKAR